MTDYELLNSFSSHSIHSNAYENNNERKKVSERAHEKKNWKFRDRCFSACSFVHSFCSEIE